MSTSIKNTTEQTKKRMQELNLERMRAEIIAEREARWRNGQPSSAYVEGCYLSDDFMPHYVAHNS